MPRRKIRAHYEHFSEFERGRAIRLKEAGWTKKKKNRSTCGSRRSAIRRCWQERVNNGRCHRWHRCQRQYDSGRPKSTTEREDREIVRAAVTAPDSNQPSNMLPAFRYNRKMEKAVQRLSLAEEEEVECSSSCKRISHIDIDSTGDISHKQQGMEHLEHKFDEQGDTVEATDFPKCTESEAVLHVSWKKKKHPRGLFFSEKGDGITARAKSNEINNSGTVKSDLLQFTSNELNPTSGTDPCQTSKSIQMSHSVCHERDQDISEVILPESTEPAPRNTRYMKAVQNSQYIQEIISESVIQEEHAENFYGATDVKPQLECESFISVPEDDSVQVIAKLDGTETENHEENSDGKSDWNGPNEILPPECSNASSAHSTEPAEAQTSEGIAGPECADTMKQSSEEDSKVCVGESRSRNIQCIKNGKVGYQTPQQLQDIKMYKKIQKERILNESYGPVKSSSSSSDTYSDISWDELTEINNSEGFYTVEHEDFSQSSVCKKYIFSTSLPNVVEYDEELCSKESRKEYLNENIQLANVEETENFQNKSTKAMDVLEETKEAEKSEETIFTVITGSSKCASEVTAAESTEHDEHEVNMASTSKSLKQETHRCSNMKHEQHEAISVSTQSAKLSNTSVEPEIQYSKLSEEDVQLKQKYLSVQYPAGACAEQRNYSPGSTEAKETEISGCSGSYETSSGSSVETVETVSKKVMNDDRVNRSPCCENFTEEDAKGTDTQSENAIHIHETSQSVMTKRPKYENSEESPPKRLKLDTRESSLPQSTVYLENPLHPEPTDTLVCSSECTEAEKGFVETRNSIEPEDILSESLQYLGLYENKFTEAEECSQECISSKPECETNEHPENTEVLSEDTKHSDLIVSTTTMSENTEETSFDSESCLKPVNTPEESFQITEHPEIQKIPSDQKEHSKFGENSGGSELSEMLKEMPEASDQAKEYIYSNPSLSLQNAAPEEVPDILGASEKAERFADGPVSAKPSHASVQSQEKYLDKTSFQLSFEQAGSSQQSLLRHPEELSRTITESEDKQVECLKNLETKKPEEIASTCQNEYLDFTGSVTTKDPEQSKLVNYLNCDEFHPDGFKTEQNHSEKSEYSSPENTGKLSEAVKVDAVSNEHAETTEISDCMNSEQIPTRYSEYMQCFQASQSWSSTEFCPSDYFLSADEWEKSRRCGKDFCEEAFDFTQCDEENNSPVSGTQWSTETGDECPSFSADKDGTEAGNNSSVANNTKGLHQTNGDEIRGNQANYLPNVEEEDSVSENLCAKKIERRNYIRIRYTRDYLLKFADCLLAFALPHTLRPFAKSWDLPLRQLTYINPFPEEPVVLPPPIPFFSGMDHILFYQGVNLNTAKKRSNGHRLLANTSLSFGK